MKKHVFLSTIFLFVMLTNYSIADDASITLSPTSVNNGSTNVTLDFIVTNNQPEKIKTVWIYSPNSDFVYSYGSGGYNGNWSLSKKNQNTRFVFTTDNNSQKIPNKGTAHFYITYQSFPQVPQNITYPFNCRLYGNSGSKKFEANPAFTILASPPVVRQITLSLNPASGLISDGLKTVLITAKLTQNNVALPNTAINFTTSAGTLSSQIATTDQNGLCQVTLTSPYSTNNTSSNITARNETTTANTTVSFTGVTNSGQGNRIIDYREVPIENAN